MIVHLWQCVVSTSIYTTLSGAISLECCSLGSFSGISVVWKSSIHSGVVVLESSVLCTHVGSTINMAPLRSPSRGSIALPEHKLNPIS